MLVQGFLRATPQGLDILRTELGIESRFYDSGLVVLNYKQYNSPMSNPLVRECRGLILDRHHNWDIVACSFNRFYNLHEDPNANFYKIESSLVQEKLDGSMITVYFHNDCWHVATRSMAYAEGVASNDITFREVFDTVFDWENLDVFKENLCFVFELVSPYNKIVTPYDTTNLYLLTVIDKETELEYSPSSVDYLATLLNVKRPKIYNFKTISEIAKAAKELPRTEEGYVALWFPDDIDISLSRMSTVYRLKIKNPAYLVLAHMRDSLSEKAAMRLAISGEYVEYLIHFPEYAALFNPYVEAYKRLRNDVSGVYLSLRDVNDQKAFAVEALKYHFSSVLFSVRKNNISIQDAINCLTDCKLHSLLKSYK